MIKKGISISVESLDALLSANAELSLEVASLQAQIGQRDVALAELQTRLNQYWDIHEDVDYRSLVDRIREDAHTVGDVLRNLDSSTRRQFARFGTGGNSSSELSSGSGKGLLPSVHSLLRTLDEWK